MATIDEIFDTMSAATTFEYLVIDPGTRQINIPDSEKLFGVTQDRKSERKYFMCPRYVGDNLDLSKCYIQINFDNGHDEPDAYLVEDLAYTDDIVTFSWLLTEKVVAYKGDIQFSIYASDGERKWNTAPAIGTSLEGLSADISGVEDQTADAIVQLRQMVSKQTAAVEAEGTKQIQNVQNAASTATANAQSQIETKGAETLASIPEDYMTAVNKVNNLANALKGSMTGTAVRADDVSPVEHYPKVRVRSKNQFDMSGFTTFTGVTYPYISEVGENYIVITSPPGYTANGVSYPINKSGNSLLLKDLCPYAEVGKTYTFSFETDSEANRRMYLSGPARSIVSGMSYTLTQAMLDSAIHPYGFSATEGETGSNCRISNIQLEEGTEATDYVPYVDPSTVTVTRCGKNLLQLKDNFTVTSGDITLSYDTDTGIFTLNGSCTYEAPVNFQMGIRMLFKPFIGKNTPMSLSVEYLGGSMISENENGGTSFYVTYTNVGSAAIKLAHSNVSKTFTLSAGRFDSVWLHVKDTVTFDNYKFRVQVEMSNTPTEHEVFEAIPYIPDEDGHVFMLAARTPTMTLLTETANVIIDCEYNRDTNIVINQLISAIQALGGTV